MSAYTQPGTVTLADATEGTARSRRDAPPSLARGEGLDGTPLELRDARPVPGAPSGGAVTPGERL